METYVTLRKIYSTCYQNNFNLKQHNYNLTKASTKLISNQYYKENFIVDQKKYNKKSFNTVEVE